MSSNLRVTSSNPWVTTSNPRVTTSDSQINKSIKTQVNSLKSLSFSKILSPKLFGNYWGKSYVQFLLTVSDQFYDRRKQQHFSSWRWCSSVLDWTNAQKIFHKICLGQSIWYVPIVWSIFQLSFPCAHLYTFWMTTLLHSFSYVWYYYTGLYVLFESVFLSPSC